MAWKVDMAWLLFNSLLKTLLWTHILIGYLATSWLLLGTVASEIIGAVLRFGTWKDTSLHILPWFGPIGILLEGAFRS